MRLVQKTGISMTLPAAILVAFAVIGGLCAESAKAEEQPITNPVAGNKTAIQEGASLFRANCSPCHGLNAEVAAGDQISAANRWTHGSSDADIFHTITQGVPGTEMPANGFEDSEIWAIIAYLRSFAPPVQPPSGDRARARRSSQSRAVSVVTWLKVTAACLDRICHAWAFTISLLPHRFHSRPEQGTERRNGGSQ